MTDLALDPTTNDLVIEAGDLKLVTGPDAIAQDLNLRVALFKGEWPLDRRIGIDYRTILGGPRLPDAVLRALYDEVFRETAGVASVARIQLQFDRRTRTLTVIGTAVADDGTTIPVYRDIIIDLEALTATYAPVAVSASIGAP